MLVVLMAIIDFSRTRVLAATRWLWLALSGGLFVAAPLGCDDEGQPEYGAPADVTVLDVEQDPGLQPEYGPPADIYMIETLYGPPPDYYEGDEGQDKDAEQYPDIQILYGPPPDYGQYDEGQDLNIQPMYGAVDIIDDMPSPDVATDEGSQSDITPDIQILYGPPAK